MLAEAWAVFSETDAVGGPEEKIERDGVVKTEGCVVLVESLSARKRA